MYIWEYIITTSLLAGGIGSCFGYITFGYHKYPYLISTIYGLLWGPVFPFYLGYMGNDIDLYAFIIATVICNILLIYGPISSSLYFILFLANSINKDRILWG